MMKKILLTLLLLFVIIFIVGFIMSGVKKASKYSISDIFTNSSSILDGNQFLSADDHGPTIEIDKDTLWDPIFSDDTSTTSPKLFAMHSPFRGKVVIKKYASTPKSPNSQEEYITINALGTNESPINITGWSLQSMVSGTRVYIGEGTLLHNAGVSREKEIILNKYQNAIISSGESPVGTNFHTNKCTGYLNQFQKFYPKLLEQCPEPSEIIEPTIDNVRTYGSTCIDFVAGMPTCTYPTSIFEPAQEDEYTYTLEQPIELSQICKNEIKKELNYFGCLERHKKDVDLFYGGEWRIFTNAQAELWRNQYEIIRLLDSAGRVVDVYSY